jgi:hypothetical protein
MRLKKRILIVGLFLILLYVGSYAAFYVHRRPAGNLAYWVYLPGGNETEREEEALYDLYYPIYKIHQVFDTGRHNYDRGINYNAIYDGDEPTKKP